MDDGVLRRNISRALWLMRLVTSFRMFADIGEMVDRYRRAIEAFSSPRGADRTGGLLVSVIVPTRNEAKKIPTLLASLRRSHYRNIEVVVADYMSSDGTPRIAKALGARVIEVDKPGVGYASFLATNESRGDVIIRTDADAVFPPHIIDYAVKVLRSSSEVQLVHIGHIYVDSGFVDNFVAFLYDKYWREVWKTTGHFIAFRRELRDIVNFNPRLRYNEDFDFGRRVYEKFGAKAIHYNYREAVLISARRIRISGRVKYLLGRVRR